MGRGRKAPSGKGSAHEVGTRKQGKDGAMWVVARHGRRQRWQRDRTAAPMMYRPPYTATCEFRVTVFNVDKANMAETIRYLHAKVPKGSTDCIVFPESYVTEIIDPEAKIGALDLTNITDPKERLRLQLKALDEIIREEAKARVQLLMACIELEADCVITGRDYDTVKGGWYNTAWYYTRGGTELYRYYKQKTLSCEADKRLQADPSRLGLQQLAGAAPSTATFEIPCPRRPGCVIDAGMLICADLEEEDIRDPMLADEPRIVFNPAYVNPYGGNEDYLKASTENSKKSFITALLPVLKTGAWVVRTDHPYQGLSRGALTSMILEPGEQKMVEKQFPGTRPGVPGRVAKVPSVDHLAKAWPPTFGEEWIHTETLTLECHPAAGAASALSTSDTCSGLPPGSPGACRG